MSKTKLPAIPAPTDANLRDVARAIKGVLDVREGNLGDPLDANVTFRDLVDGGIVEVSVVNRGSSSGVSGVAPAPGLGSPTGYDPTADLTPPPQATGLAATGSFASVILSWTIPGYSNHAFTEIWRSDTNVIGNAVMIGTTTGGLYTDYLGNSASRYYWVRLRSRADVVGAYNAINGVLGQTAVNPGLLLESLSNQIAESHLSGALGARINLVDAPATGLVTKVESLDGQYTVKVDNAGHVSGFGLASSANSATPLSEFGVRADRFWIAPPSVSSATAPSTGLYKGYVWRDTSVVPNVTRYWSGTAWTTTPQALPFVVRTTGANPGVYMPAAFIEDGTITNAKIGELAVDNGKIANLSVEKLDGSALKVGAFIQSTNFTSGASGAGWRINADGTAELQAAYIRGQLTASQINGANLKITAGDVQLGNDVGSAGHYGLSLSGSNFNNIFIKRSDGVVFFRINEGGTNSLTFDSSSGQLKIRGEINGGAYTGWAWPASGQTGFHLGPNGLLIGNANDNKYFYVSVNGDISAPGLSISNGSATFSGTLSTNIVNTDQIIGGAASVASVVTTANNSALIAVNVPAGASAMLISYYLGPPTYTPGQAGDKYNNGWPAIYGPTLAELTDNGSPTTAVTVAPAVGTHYIYIRRTNYTGNMRVGVVVLKR